MAKPDPKDLVTRSMLDQAAETILEGMVQMFAQRDKRFDAIDARLEKVDGRFDKLELGQAHLKDQVRGLKADPSKFPPRKQLEGLKRRADKYHP